MIQNKKNIAEISAVALVFSVSFVFGINFYNQGSTTLIEKANLRAYASIIDSSKSNPVILYFDEKEIEIPLKEISEWSQDYTRDYSGIKDKRLDPEKIKNYLSSIAPEYESQPIDARITIQNSKATVFTPEAPGKKIDLNKSVGLIMTGILSEQSSISLEIEYTQPEITLKDIDKLGIKDLIGYGESDFSGSPTSRIHNIKIGLSKFNGLIIKPGEEFSFNKFLGEVDGENNYKAELVIKSGELEYEYGGGICQVSTTLFRSAIDAGLPIVERKAHSFPVRYYNPQGFDSTIYPGVVDLKFKNDTPNHILIQGKVVKNKISFEIFGTKDGRIVKVDMPISYDQQPSGSMKTYFTRSISKDGETKEDKFYSFYKAPPTPKEKNPLE